MKNNRTTCTWQQTTRAKAANAMFATMQFDAPLPITESLRYEFVFEDGTWKSPSLRLHFASRDRSRLSSGVSSGPDAFERSQEATRRTACTAAAGYNSDMANLASAMYNC
ncbi:MAG: hypothetical protein QM740_21280 [Acidovorax sp.]